MLTCSRAVSSNVEFVMAFSSQVLSLENNVLTLSSMSEEACVWRERVRRRKANRRAFLQRIASGGDKEASASIVVDGYYAGVGDYSPFVISVPIQFGGGLRSTIETFSAQYPTKSIVDLQSSALSVMNAQLVGDAMGYSDYVVQAVLNAMNVIRLKNDASVDMADGVGDWKGSEG